MNTKEIMVNTILAAVEEVTGILDLENDTSLIDRDLAIMPACFLYIFDMLEKRLQLPVYDIFIDNTFEVMTVENLSNALLKLKTKG